MHEAAVADGDGGAVVSVRKVTAQSAVGRRVMAPLWAALMWAICALRLVARRHRTQDSRLAHACRDLR